MRLTATTSLCLTWISALAVMLGGCTKKINDKDTTINAVLTANIKGLDPVHANDLYSALVISQMYEPLMEYNYLKRPLQLQPLLAASMPKASKDGMTITIKIKKGVLFQDSDVFPNGKGREVTAQDFIYSWKRLADPRTKSEGFWVFDGKIKGLNEWRNKIEKGEATYDTPIEGLQAPDKYTLVIKLTRPYYQLYYVLTMPFTSVVPKEAIDKYGNEFLNHPVGTGPFKFDSWIRNSQIVLVKNPTWHGQKYPTEGEATDQANGLLADAGKALPFAQKLVFHILVEDQPRWLNLMKGNIDFAGIPKDNFDSAVTGQDLTPDMKKKGFKLYVTPQADVTYTAFNMADPFLGKHPRVRKAIALATDTQTLIKKFYNGKAIVAQSPIPPQVDSYDPNFKNPYKTHDLKKAKELLKKAGFANGKGIPELEYATTSSSTARQMAEFFKQNMADIGIKIKIVTNSWPQFTENIRNRKNQIWGIAWSADYPDAQNFFQLLYGGNVSPGPNGANFKNKEFDKLYEQASKMPPGPKRTDVYHKMRDIFVEQMPWIPGAHRLGYYVYHSWLKNFKLNSIINNYFKYLRVDPKERAQQKAKL